MVYIGSTTVPKLRFHNHLVTGKNSNEALQADILKYGLGNFVAYVFEVVTLPQHLTMVQKQALLHKIEQNYLDMYPKSQLYNSKSAATKSL
jgi:group I intron endonuclease